MRRPAIVAWLVAAPAILAAFGLTALEAYRAAAPDAPVFGGPSPASLADAITKGRGVERAYALIRAGQDPNAGVVVTDPNYNDGAPMTVSPLMLAVAARDTNIALMLINFGARLDGPQHARVLCLARQTGNAEMIAMLTEYGAAQDCTAPPGPAPVPLRDWAR